MFYANVKSCPLCEFQLIKNNKLKALMCLTYIFNRTGTPGSETNTNSHFAQRILHSYLINKSEFLLQSWHLDQSEN